MKALLYSQTGEKKGEIQLQPKIFGLEINKALIHQALRLQMANGRVQLAHTKTKGEVRGGGRKPYRQKGTGNARQGSIRNPHYIGGGIAFGPRKNQTYTLRMPKKQRRKALFCTLSAKAKDHEILVLEHFEKMTAPKTKNLKELSEKLNISRKGLFVLPEKDKMFQKSSANIGNITAIQVNYLNIRDLLTHQQIIFSQDSLKKLEEIFLDTKNAKKD